VTFRIPGRSPISGEYNGQDESPASSRCSRSAQTGRFSIPVHDVLDNDADTVVVLATHSAQRDDRELARPAVHLWRFADGKATSHESFVSDVFAQDAFWS
jgi:ketosteroid isomerase-like protein